MIYYRIALYSNRTIMWQWQSTALTSLGALFGLLRLYDRIPRHLISIFFASSTLYLDDMLRRENSGMASNSLSAELFLKEMRIDRQEMLRLEAEVEVTRQEQEEISIPLNLSGVLREESLSAARQVINQSSACSPATKQLTGLLQSEQKPGGDHDTPYVFSLPVFMPQVLAWAILLARVQRGELVP